jgi:hypothetical protein
LRSLFFNQVNDGSRDDSDDPMRLVIANVDNYYEYAEPSPKPHPMGYIAYDQGRRLPSELVYALQLPVT